MQIYLDFVPIHALRHRKFKQGNRFWLTLSGISISTAGGEVTVEPIYTPLLTIDRRGSLIYIEIAWGKLRLAKRPVRVLAVFSPTRPFLHLERTDCIIFEEDE
jgi:hypothetical protein